MVKAISAFLDFCYIVRQPSLNEADLRALDDALERFCRHRDIFVKMGICPDGISLPRQHSLQHYHRHIVQFGAPEGLSTSITESKHIHAVKKPWRRTNHFEELTQMLLINQRMDKLGAFRARLFGEGLLNVPLVPEGNDAIAMDSESGSQDTTTTTPGSSVQESGASSTMNFQLHNSGTDENVEAIVILPGRPGKHHELAGINSSNLSTHLMLIVANTGRYANHIAKELSIPRFPELLKEFLHHQENEDVSSLSTTTASSSYQKLHVFSSGTCVYNAQHDTSGRVVKSTQQVIHCTKSWKKGIPRYDCVFVNVNPEAPGFRGLYVGQVLFLFSIKSPRGSRDPDTPCALVQWFETVGDKPCDLTGMWMVKPEVNRRSKQRAMSVIHADSIMRPAHLIPIYGKQHVPHNLHAADSLDAFKGYYVNKFSDYHAYCLAF